LRKPDDSTLTPEQHAKVRAEAERALRNADALGRFPTPVADIMSAAGVTEVPEDVLNEGFIARMRLKAGDALKRALNKVIGLFDARERLVFIDRTLYIVKQTFVRLHETGHGFMVWQRDTYAIVEDCEQSISPEVADLFDREANVFASEVLFQLDTFAREAEEKEFSIFTPVRMSQKYGASVYASIRQYVSKNRRACAVLVLNPPELIEGDGFRAAYRRHVYSPSFLELFGAIHWKDYYTPDDEIGAMIPVGGRKASGMRCIELSDLNGDRHECLAEAFTQKHQVFILVHAARTLTASSVFS
jgi:hypothetical protein